MKEKQICLSPGNSETFSKHYTSSFESINIFVPFSVRLRKQCRPGRCYLPYIKRYYRLRENIKPAIYMLKLFTFTLPEGRRGTGGEGEEV